MKKYYLNNHSVLEGKIAVLKFYLSQLEHEVFTVNNPLHNRTTLIWVGFRKDIRTELKEVDNDVDQLITLLYDAFHVDYNIPINIYYELLGNDEADNILKLVQDFIHTSILKYKK